MITTKNLNSFSKPSKSGEPPFDKPEVDIAESVSLDTLVSLGKISLTNQGMKIDNVYFDRFKEKIQSHPELKKLVEHGELSKIEEYLEKIFDKPEEFFTLKNLEKSLKSDRKLSIIDILLYGFGFTERIKSKKEYVDEEFEKFDNLYKPDDEIFQNIKHFFETYLTDIEIRKDIINKEFARLPGNFRTTMKNIPENLRKSILVYIDNNIELEKFA